MSKGKRLALIRQAQLTWADAEADLQGFLETGRLGAGADDVLPYSEAVRNAVVKQFQGA